MNCFTNSRPGQTQTEVATYFGIPRTTVTSIIDTFRKHNRIYPLPTKPNRRKLLSKQQARAVVNIVKAQNDITVKQIQQQIIDDSNIFSNINSIDISTIHRTLKRNNISIKNLDIIPVGRNTPTAIENRYEYVQQSIRNSNEHAIFSMKLGLTCTCVDIVAGM